MSEVWNVIQTHERPTFASALTTHFELSGLALLIGVAIALPLALAVSRSPLASLIAVNISNIGRAVPSLAILALALPLLGLGFKPALFALTVLAIPPVLINASTGLREVNPKVIESARGMGLSEWQILTRIRLPIATPVILTGIRTSAVQVIASATLATFIGGGGLGDFIVEGIQVNNTAVQLAGAIPVALMAMATEVGFEALERMLTPRGLRAVRRTKK